MLSHKLLLKSGYISQLSAGIFSFTPMGWRVISNIKKIIGYKITKPKPSDVQSIINKVCIHLEVHKETLMNKSRTSDIVRARNVIHNLLYEKYHMNLTDIGRYFGQDHTTVLHSIEMKKQQKRFWSPEQSLWQEFEKLIS